ncbi:SLC45 family MFS transporter [Nostoc sp. C052]|uniref:MFS transporter n=1 Tax=Nostoc sp. C052 TaxID=2576902 RepID=UPI0015C3E6B5|nr:MFS transporter [Nostoc sp. C052]QLE42660.1 SLC45 family MFS transporter [Nostoc sp. C052]
MRSRISQSSILWRQVWGLAALLAAIIFSWMAYGFYQPRILEKQGFTGIASSLGILQGLLGAVVEPYFGIVSDRVMRRVGSRLPMIAAGVTLAGMIFVVVSLLLEGELPSSLRWLIPVLMTIWVIAMIVFRGPAIALLMQFAPSAELPQANVILVLIFGLVGAVGPLLGNLIQHLGASLTFMLGAVVLIVGALLLWSAKPQYTLPIKQSSQPLPTFLRSVLIFGVGLGAGLEVNLLLRPFPVLLHNILPSIGTEYITSGMLLVSGLSGLFLERLILRLGVKKAMKISLGAIAILMGLTLLTRNSRLAVGLVVAFGVAFGLLFTSQIPFALTVVPPTWAGLGTGLYFGGMGAATALISLLQQYDEITPIIGFWGGAIAFLIATSCLSAIRFSSTTRLPFA